MKQTKADWKISDWRREYRKVVQERADIRAAYQTGLHTQEILQARWQGAEERWRRADNDLAKAAAERDKAIADAKALDDEHAKDLAKMFEARMADHAKLEEARRQIAKLRLERDALLPEHSAEIARRDAAIESLKRQITNQLEREAREVAELGFAKSTLTETVLRNEKQLERAAAAEVERSIRLGDGSWH